MSLKFEVSARIAIILEPASPSFRDESPVDDVSPALDVGCNTVEPKTYMFNQKEYRSIADEQKVILLSRTSGSRHLWGSTLAMIQRNDSDDVSVSHSCAESISQGNAPNFCTSHKSNCKQRGTDVVCEVTSIKGIGVSFYACLPACKVLALM
jgi:hypothetical protein